MQFKNREVQKHHASYICENNLETKLIKLTGCDRQLFIIHDLAYLQFLRFGIRKVIDRPKILM